MKKIKTFVSDRLLLRSALFVFVCVIVFGVTIDAAFFETNIISPPSAVEAAVAVPAVPDIQGEAETVSSADASEDAGDALSIIDAMDSSDGTASDDVEHGEHGDSGYLKALAEGLPDESVASVNSLVGKIRELSTGISQIHDERLLESEKNLLFKKQINAAKYLATANYLNEMSAINDFTDIHGKVAAELSSEDIDSMYDEGYFWNRLRDLGYYREDVSNESVNKRNGIIRAQSVFNIPITAELDLDTKRALLPGTETIPRDSVTGPHPEGMWLVINKTSHILTIYIGDTVFKKYPVAIGSHPSLTPDGQFTFVSKHKNPSWGGGGYAAPVAGGAPNNPLGKRWIGISKGGGGRYGVHGNTSPKSIGTNASHGCIRMINQDVEEMYEYIELGTPIWIGSAELLTGWGITQEFVSVVPKMPDYHNYLPPGFLESELSAPATSNPETSDTGKTATTVRLSS